MKQFSNMEFWIDDFKEKLLQSFGDRIICFGLQGSYGRGEQTSTSDIDVVVILDRVSFSDLQTYRKVLDTNGCREMLCGFVAGKEELLAWEKYDLLQVGDIVIADTAEDLTVGKAIEISDVSNNIIAGLHTIACRPQRKFANRFLGYYLNSKAFHNQLVPLATGIKVYSIIKSEIVKTRINVRLYIRIFRL